MIYTIYIKGNGSKGRFQDWHIFFDGKAKAKNVKLAAEALTTKQYGPYQVQVFKGNKTIGHLWKEYPTN